MNSEWFIRFAYSKYLYLLVPSIIAAIAVRWYLVKPIVYRYALGETLRVSNMVNSRIRQHIVYALRVAVLSILALLIARPQLIDSKSKIKSEGIDIVLALDVSGSMQQPDFGDHRTRIEVAKNEAIRFVQKRDNDAIGLVLFAHDTVSRVPLTLDKLLLTDVISHIEIGDINANSTKLVVGMIAAANRLKNSISKSKIMVVLTDGAPTPDDFDPNVAIEVAKKYGIKIYTVGIGKNEDARRYIDFMGNQYMTGVDKALLQKIAQATGGKFFMVTDTHDMRLMYDTIDALETSQIELPIFSRLYELYVPYTLLVLVLIVLELILSSVVWFSV